MLVTLKVVWNTVDAIEKPQFQWSDKRNARKKYIYSVLALRYDLGSMPPDPLVRKALWAFQKLTCLIMKTTHLCQKLMKPLHHNVKVMSFHSIFCMSDCFKLLFLTLCSFC